MDHRATNLSSMWGRLVHRQDFLTTIELYKDSYTLGLKSSCDIIINSKNTPEEIFNHLSHKHFTISLDKYVPFIKDSSRHGTYLNGTKIKFGNIAKLSDGDIIALGAKTHEFYQFKIDSFNCQELDAKYSKSRSLGNGGFGEVYLAVSRRSGHGYAVKIIKTTGQDKSKTENEVKIMENLKHPNVVRMYDAYNTPEHLFLVLEYMNDGDLQKHVSRKGKLRESTAKLYIDQIATAVAYLHKNGITHRDLKPENILLKIKQNQTTLKVTDFGLSKIVGLQSAMKTQCGTPGYVAPEILKLDEHSTYTHQVDVWSLGCITFFTLFGHNPFQDNDNQRLCRKIIRGDYTIPVERVRTRDNRVVYQYFVSDAAVDLIKLMLQTEPEVRITINRILRHPWFEDNAELTKQFMQLSAK